MHTSEAGATANVPAFLSKLWKLVDDPNYDHLIHWSQNGKSFIISNQAQFAKELLPLYFKHNNMASFIRQLNMYGFRKLTNIENGGLRSEREDIEFYHIHFVKDHESSLEFIKRKIKTPLQVSSAQTLSENKNRSDDFGEILLDVKAIKGRQENVDQILINMQKENEALWREIAILRQKHQKQQQIVDKLIQFLLSLVHNRGLGVKRKSPLMIGSGETTSCISDEARAKRPTNSVDFYLNDSVGPMIFDVTDTVLEDESGDNKPSFSTVSVDAIPVETIENQAHSQAGTVINVEENVLDPLQSVIDSTIKNDNLESKEEYVYNHDGESSKSLGIPEMKVTDNRGIAQVLKPMSISYKDTGASLIPSTSGCILTQPSKSTTIANVDTQVPSDNNEESVINYDPLDTFSISEIPLSPSSKTSPIPSASKSPNSFLNTPKLLSSEPEDEAKLNETDKKAPSLNNINSVENFNEHLDSIDLELNWLNEQLSNVEGLSFDPNSLMDLDFDSTTNSQ